jgi:transcriptional regulator with PAS, ATPase and Fis domain
MIVAESDVSRAALAAVSNVFTSLGRHLLCLDEGFRVVYASPALRELLGGETFGPLEGRPVADLLGKELFGTGAPLRDALSCGERREGWRALLQTAHGIRPLSITTAPLIHDPVAICDPRVRYVVVILPAEEDHFASASSTTVLSGLIARSTAMSRIFQLVENLQASDAPVLLIGEKGTGKDVVARAIHEHSPRRRGPFVSVNCGALPPEMLESELFGHVRGAFVGAVRDRVGRFELAAQGSLFLDEISELPLPMQTRLLRVLQERAYERVGEKQSRSTDARIIAATHVDLREAVARGTFREDLYYRLRVVPIEIPPLRARREDIEPLARLLLRRVGERQGRQLRLSPEVIRTFLNYAWPGNVQELETAIEYAVAVSKGPVIQVDDLPAEMAGETVTPPPPVAVANESQRLRAALEAHRWRREETAHALGISRATLWRRMREYGLL